jgi:hypothetical protein
MNRPTEPGVCDCGAYGGGRHTKSARCDGSKPERPDVEAMRSWDRDDALKRYYAMLSEWERQRADSAVACLREIAGCVPPEAHYHARDWLRDHGYDV